MSELDRFRMTHEELIALYFEAKNDEGTELSSRKIADAATEKALRNVVAWLRTYGPRANLMASDLDAMLEEAKEQGRG